MDQSLLILLTCRELSVHAGSELYTRDVALRLKELGHRPVVYSPRLGEVAAEVRAHGIPVISDLDQIGQPPDVIHGQHHLQTVAASLHFPHTPAIFVCHGWLPWQEAPPRLPSIRRYVAVDELRRDRVVLEHGIPPEEVEVIYNFVDLDRFLPRTPVPDKPLRALLFSNQAASDNFGAVVRQACVTRNITLDIAGHASGSEWGEPEKLLAGYDLVFARGRAAMEAMAVGSGVILCDIEGVGPFVDSSNFQTLRSQNFGLAALRLAMNEDELGRQIDRFSSIEVSRVQQTVRTCCGRNEAVDQLLSVYRAALAAGGANNPTEMLIAASRYLTWLAHFTERTIHTASLQSRRTQRNDLPRHEPQQLQLDAATVAPSNSPSPSDPQLDELRRVIRSLEEDIAAYKESLERTSHSLAVLQNSPFSRVRARLLNSWLTRIYRMTRRRGGK